MINFDGVNFSERRPEEVISFFWRSEYIHKRGWICFYVSSISKNSWPFPRVAAE